MCLQKKFRRARDQGPLKTKTSGDVDDIASYLLKIKGVAWPPLLGSAKNHMFPSLSVFRHVLKDDSGKTRDQEPPDVTMFDDADDISS